MPQGEKAVTNEKIIEVMASVGSDISATAKIVGWDKQRLTTRIYKSPQLRALFAKKVTEEELPDETDQMIRDINDSDVQIPDAERKQMEAIQLNNLDLLSGGLEKAGVKPETLRKIKTLGEFEKNAGQFLVGSLDMMHRTIVYQGVVLFEHSEYLKEKLADMEKDPNTKMKDWVGVQRSYNTTVEQMMKSYDRVLTGTQVMVKLSNKKKGKVKAKPGFTPIKTEDAET